MMCSECKELKLKAGRLEEALVSLENELALEQEHARAAGVGYSFANRLLLAAGVTTAGAVAVAAYVTLRPRPNA